MEREAPRRLYRSRKDRVIAGVAGGIAEYFGINSTLVRVLWVVAALLMGPMTAPLVLLLYILLAILLPEAPSEQ